MATVAQTTLFLQKTLKLACFLVIFFNFNESSAENYKYNISLNGVNLGNAYINYSESVNKHNYKIVASAKTTGFAGSLYKLNDTVRVYGKVKESNLVPYSHFVKLDENTYKADKAVSFNYNEQTFELTNNLNNTKYTYILLNNAKDIFSTLFNLRKNLDLNNIKEEFEVKRTMMFSNKTLESKITISPAFNYKASKNIKFKAHEIKIASKRIRYKAMSSEMIGILKTDKTAKPADFFDKLQKPSDKKFKESLSIIITADERRKPLLIKYNTALGVIRATLK